MAKQFKPKTSGITIDGVENTVESVDTENAVETETANEAQEDINVNPNIEQKPPVKNVKICPNTNHSCCIGGVRYCLKKDVQTNVPVEVKEILNKSGLLKPL